MKCSNCGSELEQGDAFCINCGEKVKKRPERKPERRPARREAAAPQPVRESGPRAAYSGSDLHPPVGVGKWMGLMILMAIPLVNILVILMNAFSGSNNPSVRSFMRASLLFMVIGVALAVLGWGTIGPMLEEMMSQMPY